MSRTNLSRMLVTLVAVALCALAGPAASDARPALSLHPGRSDVVAVTSGIGYAVNVSGLDITYRATRVPTVRNPIPILPDLPGSCSTVVADVVKVLPVLPDLLELINKGDIADLIAKLIADDLVTQVDLLRIASAGVVTGTFSDLPRGTYLVGSVCNANSELYGATIVFVVSPGFSMGSSDGGSSAGSTGNGSGSNGSSIGTP